MAYPTAIDSFTTKIDHVDKVIASHVNDLQTSVVNIEGTLGYGTTVPTDAAAPSTIVKRDSNGVAYVASYYAMLYGGAVVMASSGTQYVISWTNARGQNGGMWAIGTPTHIVCPVTGPLLIQATLSWPTNSSGDRDLNIKFNNSVYWGRTLTRAASVANTILQCVAIVPVIAGDYFEVYGMQSSGGSLTTDATGGVSPELRCIYL